MSPIDQVIEMLKKLEAAIEKLQRIVNATLAVVPDILGWIVDRVIEGWNALTKKISEFFAWIGEQLAWVGDPWALESTANSWKVNVGGPAFNLGRSVDANGFDADDYWKGVGATRYRQAIPPQKDALQSIKSDFAFNIADALTGLRNAIIAYWIGILGGLITIIAGFALATGAAVTVFGIPLAPPAALAALATGLLAMIGTQLNLKGVAATSKNMLDSAAAGIQEWPKFVRL